MATILTECTIKEQRAVVRFFGAKGLPAKDIHKEMLPVYADKCLSRKAVHSWVKKFSQGRSKIVDEVRSGRPVSIATDESVQRVVEMIKGDRRVTVDSVAAAIGCSHGSAYSIMNDPLKFKKVCSSDSRDNMADGVKMMKRKELEAHLQEVEVFEHPDVKLEQYPTTPHIAACMLHTICSTYDDLTDKSVVDLGVGCGVLSIGATMLGARYVLGVDVDEDALDTCSRNLEDFEMHTVDLLAADVRHLANPQNTHLHKRFDTAVMNPPFGTKHNQGIDIEFLKAGLALSRNAVYSLHKTSTREHILKKASDWGVEAKVIAELRFDLANTLKFHKKTAVDIEVDFIRLQHKTGSHAM